MDDALKQRLVGATILVVFAVIFLPFILDGSGMEKPTEPLSLDLPESSSENTVTITLKPKHVEPATASELQTKPEVLPETPKATPDVDQATTPVDETTTPKPYAAIKPVSKAAPKHVQRQQPTPSKPQLPVASKANQAGQWVIQLGSFSQRGNAQALRDQLINKGYQSFVEASGQGSRKVFRVRVGPVASRDGAETIRKKLKQNEKRDALVMAYP